MLIIVGSRRTGNSLALAKYVKKELENDRVHCDIIVPGNQRIHICTGCMDCDESGVCDFTDDMKENIEKLRNENLVMFITPVRWNLLSGDLKIFMDRLNPMYSRRELQNKKAIVVSVGAKPGDVYSSTESTSSIRSFLESAGMDCLYTKNFDDCKDSNDIMSKTDELEEFMTEVRACIQKN